MDGTVDGVVMGAIADLVWEQSDGTLVVADWKSDSSSEAELRARYSTQLQSYNAMLNEGSGGKVERATVVAVAATSATLVEVQL